MPYFPKPSLNENDLAIIERGDTASHSIEAGQYVSWKGRTGKAKAAILQGATLDDTLFDYDEEGALNTFLAPTVATLYVGNSNGSKTVPDLKQYTMIGLAISYLNYPLTDLIFAPISLVKARGIQCDYHDDNPSIRRYASLKIIDDTTISVGGQNVGGDFYWNVYAY